MEQPSQKESLAEDLVHVVQQLWWNGRWDWKSSLLLPNHWLLYRNGLFLFGLGEVERQRDEVSDSEPVLEMSRISCCRCWASLLIVVLPQAKMLPDRIVILFMAAPSEEKVG